MRKWRFIHSVDGQGPPVITDTSAYPLAGDLREGLAHWRALASDAEMRGQPARMNGEQLAYLIAVAEAAVDLVWRAEGPMDELEARDRMRRALDALASA